MQDFYKLIADDVVLVAGAPSVTLEPWFVRVKGTYQGSHKILHIRLLNGSIAPDDPAQLQIEISYDGQEFFADGGPLVGSSEDLGKEEWPIIFPLGVPYIRLVAGGNTVQDVILRAEGYIG